MEENFKESLKKDLEDVVIDATNFEERANRRLLMLDEVNSKLSTLLDEILDEYFKLEQTDIDSMDDVDEKLKYIGENSWKLKGSASAKLKEKLDSFGKDKAADEKDIRTNMEELLREEAEALKDNSEILENYKDELLKDEEEVSNLEAEIKQYQAEIDAINSEITILDDEINAKKTLMDDTEKEIEDEREREQKQNDKIIEKESEIAQIKSKKEEETIKRNNFKEEKKQKEKELKDLEKQLDSARKKGDDSSINLLNSQIINLRGDIADLSSNISESDTKISGYKDSIDVLIGQRDDAKKEKSRINENIKKKENLLTNYRSDYTRAIEKKTEKEKEKTEREGKKAFNEEKVKSYDLEERKRKYNETLEKSKEFSKAIDENNQKITKKFRDNKITEPASANSTNNIAEGVQVNESVNDVKSKDSAGSAVQTVSNSATPASSDLTSEELAKNFANSVTKNINSPATLRKQLNGYGYQTYVNALPYLDDKSRKSVLRMLDERRKELPNITDDTTRNRIDSLLGRGTTDLLIKNDSLRNIKDLNISELRQLRSVIDKYNDDILSFSNDDIKFLDDNVMKILSNSALIEEYSNSKFKNMLKNIGKNGKQMSQVRREILGSMKDFNVKKDKRKETSNKRGNGFFETLGRNVEVVPIEIEKKDSPVILNNKSDIQIQADDEVRQ